MYVVSVIRSQWLNSNILPKFNLCYLLTLTIVFSQINMYLGARMTFPALCFAIS